MFKVIKKIMVVSSLVLPSFTFATVIVNVNKTTPGKQSVGQITFTDTSKGLLITPKLRGLPTGKRGFHVHENPSCENQGLAAGGHYDPRKTGAHHGPNRVGHLGDLPALVVDKKGNATKKMIAPKLKESDLHGRAIIIHAGGDNYSDKPEKLGGGGARIACGVIK